MFCGDFKLLSSTPAELLRARLVRAGAPALGAGGMWAMGPPRAGCRRGVGRRWLAQPPSDFITPCSRWGNGPITLLLQ